MSNVKVAIAGPGNCANSLVQGVEYYKDADRDLNIAGLMHVQLGDYHIGDVEFVDGGLPIIGDDIKSQGGATIVHRQLASLFEGRGVKIDNAYQLNLGGNMDFMKSPSVQYHDSVSHDNVEAFIADRDNTVEDLARFLTAPSTRTGLPEKPRVTPLWSWTRRA